MCVCVCCQLVVSFSALSADSQGTEDTRLSWCYTIDPSELTSCQVTSFSLSLPQDLLKVSACLRLWEMELKWTGKKKKKKCYPFKKAFWISSLVGISVSCYATSAGVQNIHKDLVASQTGNLPHEAMWAALSSVRHSDGDWEDDWVMPTGSRWKQTGDVRKRGGWKRTGEKINRQSVWQKRLGVGG